MNKTLIEKLRESNDYYADDAIATIEALQSRVAQLEQAQSRVAEQSQSQIAELIRRMWF